MELEFDKEIDAILRKARSGTGAAVSAKAENHLDADAVAAFAENALPQKARALYMEHFADCDDCRKQLSYTILTNSEVVPAPALTVVAAAETAVPWYSKLFRTPNLALAMGALVLTFGGVLGYLALQNRQAETNVAQVADKQIAKPTYSASEPSVAANANAAPANTMTAANLASNTVANSGTVSGSGTGRAEEKNVSGPSANESITSTTDSYGGGEGSGAAKPIAAAPPPAPVPADQPKTVADEKKDADKAKERDRDQSLAKRESEDRIAAEAVPKAARKTGPNRSNQMQMDGADANQVASGSVAAAPAAVKSAGGKKFENRNGAWYDTSYRGQGTTNVRRGTDEYKKLDGGLRSIADSVGGTVVVVWKGKAYRVQ